MRALVNAGSAFAAALADVVGESIFLQDGQRAARKGAPSAILQRETWSLWRQVLFVPTVLDSDRIDAWLTLSSGLAEHSSHHALEVFRARRAGIFGRSYVKWDHLSLESSRRVQGFKLMRGGVRADQLVGPHGPLVQEQHIDEHACVITDLEGISASKSSERHFDTVADFGKDYANYLGVEASSQGLTAMLAHHEVRVMRKPATDRLFLGLWDGRLFIANSGGSHHLAAAIWMSGLLGIPIHVKPKLSVRWLNEPAWQWLLQNYVPLLVPGGCRHWSPLDGAKVVGCWYWLGIPVPEACELHFVPRNDRSTVEVIRAATASGIFDATTALENLLAEQRCWLKVWQHRLPGIRFDGLDG